VDRSLEDMEPNEQGEVAGHGELPSDELSAAGFAVPAEPGALETGEPGPAVEAAVPPKEVAAVTEVRPPRRRGGRIWAFILTVAFLGGLGTGAYYYLEQRALEIQRIRAEEAARLEKERLERARGSVRVMSEPAGAEIVCDGKRAGVTPATVGDLKLGRHEFRLRCDGHEEATATAEVRENEVTNLGSVRLKRSVGSVQINTVPEGAEFVFEPAGQSAEVPRPSAPEISAVVPQVPAAAPVAPLDLRTPVVPSGEGFSLRDPRMAAMPMAGGVGPSAGAEIPPPVAVPATPSSTNGQGLYHGKSPARLENVPTGRYSLKAQKGSWVVRSDVEVLRNQLVSVCPEFLFGAVVITSDPPGAWVKKDGIALGQTPLRLGEVKPGPATFTLEMDGHEPATVSGTVAAAEETALQGQLLAIGEIVILTEPAGATIAVNGQVMGQSPLAIRGTSGSVRVKLALAGYFEEEMALEIKGGQRQEQRVTLQKPSGHSLGIPVPGKPGYVRSPYSPNSGLVEVRDFATGRPYVRGTEVKCPFTGRVFLVP